MFLVASIYIQTPEVTEINVDIGSPLTLTCTVYGVPKPEVHWTFFSSSTNESKALR